MIKITSDRIDGHGSLGVLTNQASSMDALWRFVKYELGFGGYVTEASPTRLTVRTSVLAKVDIDTYEGSEEELRPLLAATAYWYQISQPGKPTAQQIDLVMQMTHGKPLLVTSFGPMIMSQGKIRPVILAALGFQPAQFEDLMSLKPARQFNEDDEWFTMVSLVKEGFSIDEVRSLVTTSNKYEYLQKV